MNTYTAHIFVPYHSGKLSTTIQIQAPSYIQARTMLEHLYGTENVLGVFVVG